jgi:hypothetical protein
MVWVLEYSNPGQSNTNISIWDSADNARKAACCDLMDSVGYWDLNIASNKDEAIAINDYVAACDYGAAIALYNEHNADSTDYENADFFYIYKRDLLSNPQEPILIAFDPPDSDPCEEEEEKEEILIKSLECPCGLFRADCDYHK